MGWTWKDRAAMIRLYPGLANSPVLLDGWPGFAETVEEMRRAGELPDQPATAGDAATTTSKKK